MDTETLCYGTCVALGETAILLRGPSASGKSDLALRLIDQGGCLVADDQTRLHRDGDAVLASPPDKLKGLLEVRGIGIVSVPCRVAMPLCAVIDLVASDAVPRLPEDRREALLGVSMPLFALHAFDQSTPAKLRLIALQTAPDLAAKS